MDGHEIRQKPQILKLQFLRIRPEDGQLDLRNSLHVCKTVRRMFPKYDDSRNSVGMNVARVKRQLHEAEDVLADTRRRASVKYVEHDRMWKELEEKQLSLRKLFRKFHNFVKENDEKRIRAQQKINEDKELTQKRIEMTEEMTEDIDKFLEAKLEFEGICKEYKIYEDFLNKVCSLNPLAYKNVSDIINRYVTLLESKELITQKRVQVMDEMDHAKSDMQTLYDEKTQTLMAKKDEMVELVERHRVAKDYALHWETILDEIKGVLQSYDVDIEAVQRSTFNTYLNMCNRVGILPEHVDFEEQHHFIKTTMSDMKNVLRKVRKQQQLEQQQQMGGTRGRERKSSRWSRHSMQEIAHR